MKYTIKTATPTGKTDPKFGTEYLVQFNEDDRVVTVSRKHPINTGGEENGTIVDGNYGAYFKKDPFVPGQRTAPSTATVTSAPAAKKEWIDTSDGQRQGNCLTNAANYINYAMREAGVSVEPTEWAKYVHDYASALYSLGALDSTVVAPGDTPLTDPFVSAANAS